MSSTKSRSRRTAPTPDEMYGPVGSLIFCAYWRTVSRVLSHNEDGSVTVEGVEHELTSVQWHGDPWMLRVRTHMTPLGRGDRVLGEPIAAVTTTLGRSPS
jgi:hypothetical protein